MIGAIIMVHGDDSGLVLPPRIAPAQAMIIPIQQRKEGVLEKAYEAERQHCKAAGIRVKVDDTDKKSGMEVLQSRKCVVFRFVSRCGPKDIESRTGCVSVRRDTREKIRCFASMSWQTKFRKFLDTMQKEMLERARAHRDAHTYVCNKLRRIQRYRQQQTGICQSNVVRRPGSARTRSKKSTTATSRCMPFEQEHLSRCLRMLWKTGEEDGLLGKSILI